MKGRMLEKDSLERELVQGHKTIKGSADRDGNEWAVWAAGGRR